MRRGKAQEGRREEERGRGIVSGSYIKGRGVPLRILRWGGRCCGINLSLNVGEVDNVNPPGGVGDGAH